MFIGHYGIALAAKRAAPRSSLGTLLLAAQLVDLIWPLLLLAGVEHVRIAPGITRVTALDFYDYPISHSLVSVTGWAVAFALVYFAARRYARGAAVIALAIVSHWLLDALVHSPDLPLAPGVTAYVGLGIWNSRPTTLALELSVFAAGLAVYLQTSEAIDSLGKHALWGFTAFLLVMYAGNIFGPPPPSAVYVAWLGLGQWLMVAWAHWVDAHRHVRAALYQSHTGI